MVDYTKLIAANLNLDIDYKKMEVELLEAMKSMDCVPFSYSTDLGESVTAYSLFLRSNSNMSLYSYRGAKLSNIDEIKWNLSLNIPYTKLVIESFPYISLGTIRVVYFPNIPCIEHTDWDNQNDFKNTLGLSLIPFTGNTHCDIWSDTDNQWISVIGNAMLLNDSIKHRVPKSDGIRIAMRIFGDIDYSWFNDKILSEFY
jgi:hypothetical protein